jgi:hypothetical protein
MRNNQTDAYAGRTKDEGKDVYADGSTVVCICGSPALDIFPFTLSLVFVLADGSIGDIPNLPIFFNQTKIGGSFPPTHPISIPSKPRSRFPLAHTAANASPICLKATRAVPYFGGLSRLFLGDLSDKTMESVSV